MASNEKNFFFKSRKEVKVVFFFIKFFKQVLEGFSF